MKPLLPSLKGGRSIGLNNLMTTRQLSNRPEINLGDCSPCTLRKR